MSKPKILRKAEPSCVYCRYGVCRGDVVLCSRKGVVDKNSRCRKFCYDPIKRVPATPEPLPEYSPDDFSID